MQSTELAIVTGLSSHFLNILGMVLMKAVHLEQGNNANRSIDYSVLIRSKKWGFGLLLMTLGGVLYPISLGLGPITLTTSLVLSSIPFNMLLSYYILNDIPSVLVVTCSLVVIASLGFTIAYGPEESDWELTDDESMWRSAEFILWTLCMLGLCLIFWLGNKCTCGFLHEIYGFKVAVAMIEKGICSAYVAVLAKLTFMSIEQGDDGRTQIYLPIFLVLSIVPLEFPLRQRCLASTDMSKALPTMVVCVTLFSVPTGGIFFHEFKNIQADSTLFFGSLLVASIVVLVMNWCDHIVQVISPTPVINHGIQSTSRCLPGGFSKFTVPGLSRSKSALSTSKGYEHVEPTDNTDYEQTPVARTEIESCVTSGLPAVIEEPETPRDEPEEDTQMLEKVESEQGDEDE